MTSRAKGVSTLGRRLANARLRRGLSQGTVARMAGLDASYMSRIETGKVDPRWQTLVRVAHAIHVPLAELIADSPDQEPGRGPCPISSGGVCLRDLIRSEWTDGNLFEDQTLTPRQIRCLRDFLLWLQSVPREGQRAVEILLRELAGPRSRDH